MRLGPIAIYDDLTARLRAAGEWVWPTALRAILAWEFWESGITKYRGENWFADIPWADWQKGFPFPFSSLGADLNWFLATWGELVLSIMLLIGLLTRFTAISLIVVTVVATAAVHWPATWGSLGELWEGYVITSKGEGNFKLPLLFVVMLLPLVFHGGGKLSLDHLLVIASGRADALNERHGDWVAASLAFLVLGVTLVFLEPLWGIVLIFLAAACAVAQKIRGPSIR